MLNTILNMPSIFTDNSNRRLNVCTQLNVQPPRDGGYVYWLQAPIRTPCLSVGANIEAVPDDLYKAIHISRDGNWVFETVFGMSGGVCLCLYTKLISARTVKFGISLNAIALCQQGFNPLHPVSLYVEDMFRTPSLHLEEPNFFHNKLTSNIVPPVFGERGLWNHVHNLVDEKLGEYDECKVGWSYKPLYDFAPSVVEALVNGAFHRSPFMELREYSLHLDLSNDQWFMYEEIAHGVQVKGFESELNVPEFDEMVIAIAQTAGTQFTISCRMADAIDGNDKLWLIRDYKDQYHSVLRGKSADIESTKSILSAIFYGCVKVYCDLYELDPTVWLDDMLDQSSITIWKNIYDEVSIAFQDFKHDRFITFYHSLPAVLLSTMSVGFENAPALLMGG